MSAPADSAEGRWLARLRERRREGALHVAALEDVEALIAERDAARAEVERLRGDLARCREVWRTTAEGWRHEVAEIAGIVGAPAHTAELAACVRAEIEMLRGVGCREAKEGEPASGPCGVCLKCAEERGAEWAIAQAHREVCFAVDQERAQINVRRLTSWEICRDARRER